MIEDIELMDKNAVNRPIELPDHPYIAALKDFGLDELVAGCIDAVATTAVNFITPAELKQYILPFVGPVMEKVGFFPRHLKRARDIYKTTPESKRKSFGYYFKDGIKHGGANLAKDVLFHDPIYIGLMYLGLNHAPQIPPGVLSAVSYVIGVLAVAGIDVAKDEFRHSRFKKKLKNSGFKEEQYYESRFCVRAEKPPQAVIESLIKEFNLTNTSTIKYHDYYFDNTIPSYSGRRAKLRLRKRQRRADETDNARWGPNPDFVNTVQIVYTRAGEQRKGVDQCRYFPVRKEKLYNLLPQGIDHPEFIEDKNLRDSIRPMLGGIASHNLEFERTLANNNELAVCTDKIDRERSFYILELKVYNDTKILRQAMRYLMVECPIAVMQTTRGKSELFNGF